MGIVKPEAKREFEEVMSLHRWRKTVIRRGREETSPPQILVSWWCFGEVVRVTREALAFGDQEDVRGGRAPVRKSGGKGCSAMSSK